MQRGKLKAKKATDAISVVPSLLPSSDVTLSHTDTISLSHTESTGFQNFIYSTEATSSTSLVADISDKCTNVNNGHIKHFSGENSSNMCSAMITNSAEKTESSSSIVKDEDMRIYNQECNTRDTVGDVNNTIRAENQKGFNDGRDSSHQDEDSNDVRVASTREMMIAVKEEMKRRIELKATIMEKEKEMLSTVEQKDSCVANMTSDTLYMSSTNGGAIPSSSSHSPRAYMTRRELKCYQAKVWNAEPYAGDSVLPLLHVSNIPTIESVISLSTRGGTRRTDCKKITFAAPCGIDDATDSINSFTSMSHSSSLPVKKSPPERTLFVARLPITVTDKDLKDFGNQFGRVESVIVTRKRRTVLAVRDKMDPSGTLTQDFVKESDRIVSCGYGFIVFAKTAEVKKAISAYRAFKDGSGSSHELSVRRRPFMIHNKEILVDEMRGRVVVGGATLSSNIPTVNFSQLPPVPLTFPDSLIYSDEDSDKDGSNNISNRGVGEQTTIIEPFVFASVADLKDAYKREAFSSLRATQQERLAEQRAQEKVIEQKRRKLAADGVDCSEGSNEIADSTAPVASLIEATDQWKVKKIIKRIQERNKRNEEKDNLGEIVDAEGNYKTSRCRKYLGHGVDPYVEYHHPLSLALTPGNRRQVIRSSYPTMPATLEGSPRFCEFFPPAAYVLGNYYNKNGSINNLSSALLFTDYGSGLTTLGGPCSSDFAPAPYCPLNNVSGGTTITTTTTTTPYQSLYCPLPFNTAVMRYQYYLRRRVRRRRRELCMAPFIPMRFRANKAVAMMCPVRRQYWARVLQRGVEKGGANNICNFDVQTDDDGHALVGQSKNDIVNGPMNNDQSTAAGLEAFLAEFAEGADDVTLFSVKSNNDEPYDDDDY